MRRLACLAAALAVCGCATTEKSGTGTSAANEARGTAPSAAAAQSAALASRTPSGTAEREASAAPAKHTLYFDFDSNEIKPEYTSLIQAHSRYMEGHDRSRLRIEGNCDERGSREYNLALGQRRAQAVKHAMVVLGVPTARIETVSYGEEKPAAPGHDESAWSLNRRDELRYAGQ